MTLFASVGEVRGLGPMDLPAVERMLAEPFPRDALPLLDALGASPGGLTDDAPLAALRPGIVAPRRITAAAAAPGHRSAP